MFKFGRGVLTLALVIYLGGLCACRVTPTRTPGERISLGTNQVAALNALKDDLNGIYGFRDAAPRIDLGPCGRFAKAFREAWNARFRDPVTIVFVMSPDGTECYHVLIKLPDGSYYDGGNGVMTEATLLTVYPASHIEEMKDYRLELLDKRSYGLKRDYPLCPNYSDTRTAELIERHLSEIVAAGGCCRPQ